MESSNIDKNREDMNVKYIETENQFWLWIQDIRNEFSAFYLVIDVYDLKKLLEFRDKMQFLTHKEILQKDGKTLSQEILENKNTKRLINTFDDLVSRIKVFKTKKELKQILEENNEFFAEFKLGLKQ